MPGLARTEPLYDQLLIRKSVPMKGMGLIIIIFLFGCSSKPTRYQELAGQEGYSDKTMGLKLRMTTFQGNSNTKKDRAELFAKFRAIEICHDKSKTNAHILSVRDKSYQKEITQTTTDYPSYYYGSAPYYGRYGYYGSGVSMSYGTASTRSWNETYSYPMFDVYFECVANPIDARMSFKPLSASQVKDFVKDVMGAVQVDEILPDSPNKGILQTGDIILKANGTRVATIIELYEASRNSDPKSFKVEFLREGVKKNATVKFLDVTEMVAESRKAIIKEACKDPEVKDQRSICK